MKGEKSVKTHIYIELNTTSANKKKAKKQYRSGAAVNGIYIRTVSPHVR